MSKLNGDHHASDIQPEQLTAYALGQLHGDELAAVKAAVGQNEQSGAGDEIREVQTLAAAITAARNAESPPKPSAELRTAVESRLDELAATKPTVELPADRRPWNRQWTIALVAGVGICCVLVALLLPAMQASRRATQQVQVALRISSFARIYRESRRSEQPRYRRFRSARVMRVSFAIRSVMGMALLYSSPPSGTTEDEIARKFTRAREQDEPLNAAIRVPAGEAQPAGVSSSVKNPGSQASTSGGGSPQDQAPLTQNFFQGASTGSGSLTAGGGLASTSPQAGGYPGASTPGQGQAKGYGGPGGHGGGAAGFPGSSGDTSGGGKYGASIANNPVPGTAAEQSVQLFELEKVRDEFRLAKRPASATESRKYQYQQGARHDGEVTELVTELTARTEAKFYDDGYHRDHGLSLSREAIALGEQYETIIENSFLSPLSDPLSTFSIDVDTASYANVRRFLNEGRLPPPAAVRIEELVNYFNYSYPQPAGKEPFSVNMEAAECPWNAGHLLLRVGLKGKEVHRSERPPSNLTFLLDVSGSMADENKLPLLKATLLMMVAELTENDRVSIVTYAGEAGLRLPPTRGNEKDKIMAAINSLSSGGSTHGSAGIQLAYEQAGQYFLKDGTNRVILATDGDLNVGVTSDDALVELIKEKAAGGTFLTVLGFGTGNLKDGKLEKLADNGNGVYAYIDGIREGRKVLVEQMSGNLVTIAKDVKIQLEFNPAQIASYRLLGYENRVLAAADFNNDKKDAGEIGAGHTVTALYELVPVGAKEQVVAAPVGEPLKYQSDRISQIVVGDVPQAGTRELTEVAKSGELLTLKLRYKEPDGVESRLVEFPLKERGGQFHAASKDLQFAAAVVSFGMILRGSEHRGSGNLPAVAEIASGAIDADASGYRAEFVDLVRKAQSLGAK